MSGTARGGGQKIDSVGGVRPPNDVASPIVHDRSLTSSVCQHHDDDRQHGADYADDHQNPAHFVDVETVLVRSRHRPIENGPNGKRNDADYKSTSPNHVIPFPRLGRWTTRLHRRKNHPNG